MRAVKEVFKQAGKDTATVTAITVVGLGIHHTCGYAKDSAVSFFNAHNSPSAETDASDVVFRKLDSSI